MNTRIEDSDFKSIDSLSSSKCHSTLKDLTELDIELLVLAFVSVHTRSDGKGYAIRSIKPGALCLIANPTSHGRLNIVALDLANPLDVATIADLQTLLSRAAVVVTYDAKRQLQCLWSLGIEKVCIQLYDLKVAEMALTLGLDVSNTNDLDEHFERAESAKASAIRREARDVRLSLDGLIHRYLGCESNREFVPSFDPVTGSYSFASGPSDIALAAKDAAWISKIYPIQLSLVQDEGLDQYLREIEFKFTAAIAWIEWNGAYVSKGRLGRLYELSSRARLHYERLLFMEGIYEPLNPSCFEQFLKERGFHSLFPKDPISGFIDIKNETLEILACHHPAIDHLRWYREFQKHEKFWNPRNVYLTEARMHPGHEQFGTATGRNTFSIHQLGGIGRKLRPLVVAPEGFGIVEFDWAQIEPVLMASEFGEQKFLDEYQRGDAYSQIAQAIFVEQISESERLLNPDEFKKAYPHLRAKVKETFLAVSYGQGVKGLAVKLGTTKEEAGFIIDAIFERYPRIRNGLYRLQREVEINGFIDLGLGLKRTFPEDFRVMTTNRAKRLAMNSPIQGRGAIILKAAVNAIHDKFRGTRSRIVLTLHDSILVEAPLEEIATVTREVKEVMESAANHLYPGLRLRVEINNSDISCWNEEGNSDSFERFIRERSEALHSSSTSAF